jgi:TldD protein
MVGMDLCHFSRHFKEYTELRLQENRSVRITFVKGNATVNSAAASSGLSCRVYKNGSWGFASTPLISKTSAEEIIKEATNNTVFLDSRLRKNRPGLPVTTGSGNYDFTTKKKRYSKKELYDFIKTIDEHVKNTYPDLSSRTVGISCMDMEKSLVTSDGTNYHSMIPRSFIIIILTKEKNGEHFDLYEPLGGFGQFEDIFNTPEEVYPRIEQLYQHLSKKVEGVYVDAGMKTCILGSHLTGILAHEAIGHTVESDLVMSGSIAADWIDKQIASPLITLIDYAHSYNGQLCPVPVFVDDEGTPAEDAVIIDKGVLKSYMHNKESALHFKVKPTGNARAYAFSDEPLIRMRNTFILPGTNKLEDMISSIDDGYYFIRSNNGQADMSSEFMFGISLGYEIKNGKIGRAIRDTTISGVAFDMLKTVDMVSDEYHWSGAGMCGKKQPMPVGFGGPDLKCIVNVGGR